ncbi:TVP38/TMEM64 family protein [Catalinimonas niigatensis]|uniref:TVP38/TMEM64 family protein n=1 Tax=Catalinimonas niigatensis TaxID=1397264 RepID=UPI0026666D31|nr:TVP38/TMEM64 family protein [Catalinimonas niigatensis]WPP48854.1 TVP38/TMEM64 family protein [Catalinimonas niigatensis]
MSVKSRIKNKLQKREEERKQSIWVFVFSGAILLTLVLSYFLIPSVQDFMSNAYEVLTSDDEQRIKDWVNGFGFWGPLIIVAAMVAQMFLIVIPSPLLMIVSTLAYGPWWGSVISYIAVAVASTIAYFIGYHASNAFVDKIIGHKSAEKVDHYIQKYGVWAVVLFRVSPFLSNDAISFVAGLGNMRYVKFILATTAGIIPLIAMIAFLGRNTDRLQTGMLWISGVTIVAFIIYFLVKRNKSKGRQQTEN